MPRVFVPSGQIRHGEVAIDGADAHHLRDVLRLGVGDTITVLDGDNRQYEVRLTGVESGRVCGEVLSEEARATEPSLEMTLAQCLPKGEKMEWVLQKGTEVGFAAFIPVASERSIVRLDGERAHKKHERWVRVVREAAQQAGRARLSEVHGLLDWAGLCRAFDGFDQVILPWEGEQSLGLRAYLRKGLHGRILVVIGPEGGLSLEEVEQARRLGACTVSLGKRILRTETAGLVVGACLMYEAGEMDKPDEE